VDSVKRKIRALAIGILLALPADLGGQEMHFGSPYLVVVDSKYGYMDASFSFRRDSTKPSSSPKVLLR
jgi:hypothetical protein